MSIFQEVIKEQYKNCSLSPSPLIKHYLNNFPIQKIKITKKCFSPKNPQNRNFIYSIIDDLSGLKFKKKQKIYKGKLIERRQSIFHLSKEKKEKPLKKLKNYHFIQKPINLKISLPHLTKRDKMNNYIIRDYKSENDPDYLKYISKREDLDDKYEELKQKILSNNSQKMKNKFEKIKNRKILDNILLPSDYDLSDKNKKSRNKTINIEKFFTTSENIYKKEKNKYISKIKSRIKEQGKVLSQQIENLKKDIVIDMDKCSNTINNENNIKLPFDDSNMPKLISDNLIHRINLKRVINDSKNIYRVINEDENDLGMDNMELFKEERRKMEFNYIRIIGNKKPPKFIKSKVRTNTEKLFHSLSGNFFGVAC